MKSETPQHPGVYLKSIKPEVINNTALAAKLDLCRTTLWRFMNGKRRLNPEMAVRLAKITDKPAREWIDMQAAFDAHQVASLP